MNSELQKLIEQMSFPVEYKYGNLYDAEGGFICTITAKVLNLSDEVGNLIATALNNLQEQPTFKVIEEKGYWTAFYSNMTATGDSKKEAIQNLIELFSTVAYYENNLQPKEEERVLSCGCTPMQRTMITFTPDGDYCGGCGNLIPGKSTTQPPSTEQAAEGLTVDQKAKLVMDIRYQAERIWSVHKGENWKEQAAAIYDKYFPKGEPQEAEAVSKLASLYKRWCKETKRNGSVLIGSSIQEFFQWASSPQGTEKEILSDADAKFYFDGSKEGTEKP